MSVPVFVQFVTSLLLILNTSSLLSPDTVLYLVCDHSAVIIRQYVSLLV